MRLYTRTGDEGYTHGPRGVRMAKYHPLIDFYGSLDEANSALGLARSLEGEEFRVYDGDLRYMQGLLFRVGFTVTSGEERVSEGDVRALEEIADKYYTLGLRRFILPSGPPFIAALHLARSLVRRAERRLVELYVEGGHRFPKVALKVLNRMSDSIFAMALDAYSRSGIAPEEVE